MKIIDDFKAFGTAHELPEPEFTEPRLSEKMLLICGDFYGIQDFIFHGLATKHASKVLRAKSAFILLFMEALARHVASALGDGAQILSANAGKFDIIAPQSEDAEGKIAQIREQIDSYFIREFYGISGVGISVVSFSQDEWKRNYEGLRRRAVDAVEMAKFAKFNLTQNAREMDYPADLNNQNLCPICNLRKASNENCEICDKFIKFGQILTGTQAQIHAKNDLGIGFADFALKIDDALRSYVPKGADGEILTFEQIAQNSRGADDESGVKSLCVLKADVDNMGTFIRKEGINADFATFSEFSSRLNAFFSHCVPHVLRTKFPNIYTIFAGGDDLFLIGAWNEVLEFARFIRGKFAEFCGGALTISFGLVICKPHTPLAYLARVSEECLEMAKGIDSEQTSENPKNAITLFGETVKFDEYLQSFNTLNEQFSGVKDELNMAFLYRLLIFCNMSKNLKFDIVNSMWKSKFRYSLSRNNADLSDEFKRVLSDQIEQHPSATKMFLCELIYKRRKNG